MASRRFFALLFGLITLFLAACQPEVQAPPAPTVIPFPTATPGSQRLGALPTPPPVLVNPVAPAQAQPTATPIPEACPAPSDLAELNQRPDDPAAEVAEILRYLSAGGTANELEIALRSDWDALGEDGFVRADIDLTGRGEPEILIGYIAEDGGTLLVLGCDNRRYVERYRESTGTAAPPQVLSVIDLNQNDLPDLAYALEECAGSGDEERCQFRTQIITWQPALDRFVDLISGGILSDTVPEIQDSDNDQVQELVINQDYVGDIITGPLRIGLKIYDWDGTNYVLSIVQPDALRYRIQVLHEADRYLASGRMDDAIRLYQRALTDEDLDTWLRNETPTLEAYALYRMLLARAFNNQAEAIAVYEALAALSSAPAAPDSAPAPVPVYVTLAQIFWDNWQISADVSAACADVRAYLDTDTDAVDFLNRYGNRNLTYTVQDLCPF